jgi:hypothetical protein
MTEPKPLNQRIQDLQMQKSSAVSTNFGWKGGKSNRPSAIADNKTSVNTTQISDSAKTISQGKRSSFAEIINHDFDKPEDAKILDLDLARANMESLKKTMPDSPCYSEEAKSQRSEKKRRHDEISNTPPAPSELDSD